MIIAVANQKGGVAKTTSVICLGGLLSQFGNCLVIDLDPQGNLTTGLGVMLEDDQPSCYEVITEQIPVTQALITVSEGLSLLPADINLAKGEAEILTQVGNFCILKEVLESVRSPKGGAARSQFDWILIDCPPSLGLLTVNALSAADYVLIPVQCQFFALKGLVALLETITSIQKRLNESLKILGVLPTMAEKQTIMTKDVMASLAKRFPDEQVFEAIPKSVKFSEANVAGEPIHLYTNDAKLIQPYQSLAEYITKIGVNNG